MDVTQKAGSVYVLKTKRTHNNKVFNFEPYLQESDSRANNPQTESEG